MPERDEKYDANLELKSSPNAGELYRTRSPEAQEIIGKMPSWIIRAGIGTIFLLLLIAFVAAALIKYPDTIQSKLIIIPSNLPVKVTSLADEKIKKLMVKDGDEVKEQQIILILASEQDREFIEESKRLMQRIDTSIQIENIRLTSSQLTPAEQENLLPGYQSFVSLAGRYIVGTSTLNDPYIQQQIRTRSGKILETIEKWEKQNLIKSPIDGKVIFLKQLSPGTQILHNDELLAIQPVDNSSTSATAFVSANQSKYLEKGNNVIIKLVDYPFSEYGILKGRIKNIPPIAFDNEKKVEIDLPNGLMTTKGFRVPPTSQIYGVCEIELNHSHTILNRMLGRD